MSRSQDTPVAYAHAVEQVDEVLGGEVAGGARRVGAAAQPAHRRVEGGDAGLEPDEDVGERRPAGVVHVHRDGAGAGAPEEEVQDLARLVGRADADGVAERHLVAAQGEEPLGDGDRLPGIDLALVGAAPDGGDVAADPQAALQRRPHHRLEGAEGLVDGLVDVLLVVGLGRREEHGGVDRRVRRPRLAERHQQPVEPLLVGDEDDVAHAGQRGEPPGDLLRVGEGRDPFRRDEARGLDAREARLGQRPDEGELAVGRDDAGLVLQAVARPHLVDGDALRHLAHP